MTTFIIKMKVGVNRLKILMSDRDIASRLATDQDMGPGNLDSAPSLFTS
jgi:hypothetical protein